MRAQEFVREGLPPFLTNVFRAGEPAVAKALQHPKNEPFLNWFKQQLA